MGRRDPRLTVTVFAEIYGPVMLAIAPLGVMVAWSRVRLADHTVAQIVVGGVVGGLVTGLSFRLLR